MTPFHVGMKVVCVDDRWVLNHNSPAKPKVSRGDVLTISRIVEKPSGTTIVGLEFDELPNGIYNSEKFIPAGISQEAIADVQLPDVIIKGTVKDTAIANYGRVSASEVAKAVGTTRNSIIGHWFRARSAGLIQTGGAS